MGHAQYGGSKEVFADLSAHSVQGQGGELLEYLCGAERVS